MGTCGRRCRYCCRRCRRRSRTRNYVLVETDKIVTVAVQVSVAVVMAVLHGLMIVKGSCVEKMLMIVMVIGVRLVMQHDMSRWRVLVVVEL